MIPDLVYYQLIIIILLWLCFMLPYLWPSPHREMPTRPGAPPQAQAQPLPRAPTLCGPDAQA